MFSEMRDNRRSAAMLDASAALLTIPARTGGATVMADCHPTEVWKPVLGFESRYEVSSCGRVRSLRFVNRVANIVRDVPLLLRPSSDHRGYQRVGIKRASQRGPQALVHALVLEAFIGLRPVGHECGHLDGNPRNNHLSNLKWVTTSENMGHKRFHGTDLVGERHGCSQLTAEKVNSIRAARLAGETLLAIGRRFGISAAHVGRLCRRQAWKHLI